MKPYRAVVLFTDGTFYAHGFDDKDAARRWCDDCARHFKSKLVFWSFVCSKYRYELTYTDL